MKNRSLIIIGVALIIILTAAVMIYPSLADKANGELTTASPSGEDTLQYPRYTDITVFDKDGKPVKLSDYEGKPVILNFWATWCGYCIQEMPDFQKAYEQYGDEVQFLIVNTDDGITKGESFIADNGYTFPTCYDLEYSAAITYGITGIPRTIAIDKNGFVRYNRSGMIDAAMLETIISTIK